MSEHRDTEDSRREILHFLSSQMGTHAAMIVGFSVVLFTFMQVVVETHPSSLAWWQYLIVVFMLPFPLWAIVYLVFRLSFYAYALEKAIKDPKIKTWEGLIKKLNIRTEASEKKEAEKTETPRILYIFPIEWFVAGFLTISKGGLVSLTLSVILCIPFESALFWNITDSYRFCYPFYALIYPVFYYCLTRVYTIWHNKEWKLLRIC